MQLPQDYLDDLLVRMTHHSTAIENNTISLPETVSILLHNTVQNRSSLREVYEIVNHRDAMEYLFAEDRLREPLSVYEIKETHALLMDRLHHERGRFKTVQNAIVGADFETAAPEQVVMLMTQWVDNVNHRLGLNPGPRGIIELACESHIEFERIHPFADGNGRVGRLLLNKILLQQDLAPLVIEKKDKGLYIEFLSKQDIKGFADFAEERIRLEEARIERFRCKSSDDLSR